MNDSRDLKAIAEACQQHQPLRFMRSHGALYIRNDNGIVFDVHQNRSFPEFMAQNKDYADLVLAANPETILALIAENQQLSAQVRLAGVSAEMTVHQAVGRAATDTLLIMHERDQLKAENGALRKHQPSAEVIWCACGDGHVANSYGAGFMDANKGVCANCDAAMGKGE